jgi:hypothetical protein
MGNPSAFESENEGLHRGEGRWASFATGAVVEALTRKIVYGRGLCNLKLLSAT